MNLKTLSNAPKEETPQKAATNPPTNVAVPFFGNETLEGSSGSTPTRASNNDALILTILFAAVLVVALMLTIFYFFFLPETNQAASDIPVSASVAAAPILAPDQGVARNRNAFAGLSLRAQSAIVYDPTSDRVLYARDDSSEYALASVTKIMTALVAAETLESTTEITISASALSASGEHGLSVGEVWRVGDLIDFMLVTSSNDAAQALAEAAGYTLRRSDLPQTEATASLDRLAFVQAMNRKAQELGLTQTYFENASGLDLSATTPGAYGTAKDMTRLLQYSLANHPNLLEATRDEVLTVTSVSGTEHTIRNTNRRVDGIPGMIASKTGFTDLAGGNLVVAVDLGLGQTIIVVVLGSSFEERFSDVETLIAATRNFMTGTPPTNETD